MTAVDQDQAADRAARELAKRLRANPAIADIDAFARKFLADMRVEHWRCLPPAPDPIEHAKAADPAPPNEDYRAAKVDLLTRKDTEDHA